jgi:hypothetical protein
MVETLRTYPNGRPYRNDYFFATPGVTKTKCTPVYDSIIRERGLSDHWPVLADLSLAAPVRNTRRSV